MRMASCRKGFFGNHSDYGFPRTATVKPDRVYVHFSGARAVQPHAGAVSGIAQRNVDVALKRLRETARATVTVNSPAESGAGFAQRGFRIIAPARPEEAFQPIAFIARHNVHVKMRHALADLVVDCDETAFGFHRQFDSALDFLHGGKEAGEICGGKVREGLYMSLRTSNTCPGKSGR